MEYNKRILEKKDFSTLLGVTIFFHIFGIHITNYNYLNILIECVAVLIILIIYFFKTFRKNLSEKTINWLWGVTGIINSFTYALLFSFSFNINVELKVLIWIFSNLVLLVLFVLLKLLYNYSNKLYQQKKDIVKPTSIIVVLSVIGSLFGVYISKANVISMVDRGSLIFGLLSIVFSTFSLFIFKSKHLANQGGKTGDKIGEDKTGDG